MALGSHALLHIHRGASVQDFRHWRATFLSRRALVTAIYYSRCRYGAEALQEADVDASIASWRVDYRAAIPLHPASRSSPPAVLVSRLPRCRDAGFLGCWSACVRSRLERFTARTSSITSTLVLWSDAQRHSRGALVLGFMGSLLFVAAGVWMLSVGANLAVAISCVGLFSLCAVAWCYALYLKSQIGDSPSESDQKRRA